jgi:hypothetical protein
MEKRMGHWHVGHNTPGYLPESNVSCFDDLTQAVVAYRAELLRVLDDLPQESQVPGMDGEFLDHHTWLHLNGERYVAEDVRSHGRVQRELNDGRALPIVYWVEAADGETAACEWNATDDQDSATALDGPSGAVAANAPAGGR